MKKIDIIQGMLECLAVARASTGRAIAVYYTAEQSQEDADKFESIEIIKIGDKADSDRLIANHRESLKYVRIATPDAMYSLIYHNQTINGVNKVDIREDAYEEMLDYIKQAMNKGAN